MPTTYARSLAERLDSALARVDDVEGIARAVFDAIGPDVPFSFGCLATTDPATQLITRAVKSAPLPLGDNEFAAAEYGDPDINQFAHIADRPVPVAVLSVDTGGHVESCRRMRDYMTPQFGFVDEIRLVCQDRGTIWGALAIYRGAGEPAFTSGDGAMVATTGKIVAGALRRSLFAAVDDTVGAPAPAVLVVDALNRVTDMSAAARAQLDELGGLINGNYLPSNVAVVVAAARSTQRPAHSRVRGASGRWWALRALTLDGSTGRSVVLTVDEAPQSAIGEMTLAARGLTAREQDVAKLVLQGASTKVIAHALFLSPHTVQDHLKTIFAKLGVNSRRDMIAQLVLP